MATIRETLKAFFSSGKKPTQGEFHQLIDSYFHKTDDGLAMNAQGNLGVGVVNPEAALHVGGGLKIGEPNDLTPPTPGTLRWNGAQLQIFFANVWQDIWPPATVTIKTKESAPGTAPNLGNKLLNKSTNKFDSATFNFPNNALKLLRISFLVDYRNFTGSTLSVVMSTSADINFFSALIILPDKDGDNQKVSFDLAEKAVVANGTYSFKFLFTPPAPGLGRTNNGSITLKSFAITCQIS